MSFPDILCRPIIGEIVAKYFAVGVTMPREPQTLRKQHYVASRDPPRWRALPCAVIAVSASLLLYSVTLLREVEWGDPAELCLQACRMGVTHPPGYPVHTILGKLMTLGFSSPAVATNFLSAVCTSLVVGLLAFIVCGMTRDRFASFAAAIMFAVNPMIWRMAVTTEIYNVSILLLGLTVFGLFAWHRRGSVAALAGGAAVFGVALGCNPSNVLLVPAFAFLVARSGRRTLRSLLLFLVVAGGVGLAAVGWNFCRAGVEPPLGTEFIPTTMEGGFRYLAGAQYGTVRIRDAQFYVAQNGRQAVAFATNTLVLGILLGVAGHLWLWRRKRILSWFLLLVFAINIGYFTEFNPYDFETMVTPAYFVFAIWAGLGIHATRGLQRQSLRVLVRAAVMAVVIAAVAVQLPPRLERARSTPVTDFVLESFEVFHRNAAVIAGWARLTPLLYHQRVHGLRPDLLIVERNEQPRHYAHGTVTCCSDFAAASMGEMPVFVDEVTETMRERCCARCVGGGWYLLEPRDAEGAEAEAETETPDP